MVPEVGVGGKVHIDGVLSECLLLALPYVLPALYPHQSQLRDLIRDFYNSRYAACLSALDSLMPSLRFAPVSCVLHSLVTEHVFSSLTPRLTFQPTSQPSNQPPLGWTST